ncbi:hypothetical protein JCM6882_007804 [Rhodosporidiobolus microsporus]
MPSSSPPQPPRLNVDPWTLPKLLDEQLAEEVILPFCCKLPDSPPEDDNPPFWSATLEAWYQTVNDSVWDPLYADDGADREYIRALVDWLCLEKTVGDLTVEEEKRFNTKQRKRALEDYDHAIERLQERYRRLLVCLEHFSSFLKPTDKVTRVSVKDAASDRVPYAAALSPRVYPHKLPDRRDDSPDPPPYSLTAPENPL